MKSEADTDHECQCSHQGHEDVIKEEVDANTNPVNDSTVEHRPDPQPNPSPPNQEPDTNIEPIKYEIEDSVCCCTDHNDVPDIKEEVNSDGEREMTNSMPSSDHGKVEGPVVVLEILKFSKCFRWSAPEQRNRREERVLL